MASIASNIIQYQYCSVQTNIYLSCMIVFSSFYVTGITCFYGVFQLAVWWFCHVVSLFWGIQFPFHARSFKEANHVKYIHIPMVIVGLVLPTLPVIVTFTAGEPSMRGFRMITFPPILCGSLQRDLTFYSLVLPLNLFLVSGIPLLIMILWAIYKVITMQDLTSYCDICRGGWSLLYV